MERFTSKLLKSNHDHKFWMLEADGVELRCVSCSYPAKRLIGVMQAESTGRAKNG